MKTYTLTKIDLLTLARVIYAHAYQEGTTNGAAGVPYHRLSDDELDEQAEEMLNFYTDWWGDDDDDELDVPDDVDESNYDPYLGQDFFEFDHDLYDTEE